MARLPHDGYGMLETNRVDRVNMESQCELSATDYPDGAEVGTIVGIDKAKNAIVKPADSLAKGILANSERLYNQYAKGLKNYIVEGGAMASVLMLETNHTFTTNTCGGAAEFADADALVTALEALDTTPLYANWDANGILSITATAANMPFQVVKYYTMPDGQAGVKFMVIRENLFEAQ